MPLAQQGASSYTETVKSAAQANGAIAVAQSGRSVRSSASSGSVRPAGALGAIVKASAVARSSGLAPPRVTAPSGPLVGLVSAHTSSKSSITVGSDGYDLYTFTTVGNGTFVVSDGPIVADIFVLGGGGSGSFQGGGAGGLGIYSNVSIPAGSYVVTVGNGGAAPANANVQGNNGGNSTISVSGKLYRGIGGGGAGNYDGAGNNGGCGGGGMRVAGREGLALQSASDGGFDGYPGAWYIYGGGGGGMGGPGTGNNLYRGGPGITSSFTGTSVAYGGGGGSGVDGPALGGTGGGGNGRSGTGDNGTDGLGGGGGGGYSTNGGKGGSGRVMIRIKK